MLLSSFCCTALSHCQGLLGQEIPGQTSPGQGGSGGGNANGLTVTASPTNIALGQRVNLTLSGQGEGTEINWSRACSNGPALEQTAGECGCTPAPSPATGFPHIPAIYDSPVNTGAYVYKATVGSDIASANVTIHPPDNIVLKLATVGEFINGSTFIKHTYKFRWGRTALGPCATEVCVQESLKWSQPQKSIDKIGKLPLEDVPPWWPACPIPKEGVVGNRDAPELVSWKWDSPYLVDFHGLFMTSAQLDKFRPGEVAAVSKQVVRATGGRCNGAPGWELKKEYTFEWVVSGTGGSKRRVQQLKK